MVFQVEDIYIAYCTQIFNIIIVQSMQNCEMPPFLSTLQLILDYMGISNGILGILAAQGALEL